jgi:hypothetical protein
VSEISRRVLFGAALTLPLAGLVGCAPDRSALVSDRLNANGIDSAAGFAEL